MPHSSWVSEETALGHSRPILSARPVEHVHTLTSMLCHPRMLQFSFAACIPGQVCPTQHASTGTVGASFPAPNRILTGANYVLEGQEQDSGETSHSKLSFLCAWPSIIKLLEAIGLTKEVTPGLRGCSASEKSSAVHSQLIGSFDFDEFVFRCSNSCRQFEAVDERAVWN